MLIQINGKEMDFDEGANLRLLMEKLNQPQKGVALAVNNEVVPASQWESYQLQNSDKLTIIKAVQGG